MTKKTETKQAELKEVKQFSLIPTTLRAVIAISEIEEKEKKAENPSTLDTFNFFRQKLVIVTGGAYDPNDSSYDIEVSHGRELITNFLLKCQTP